MMQIQDVYFNQKTQEVTVTAILEDMVLMRHQTLYDPPEYGPALCTTSFYLEYAEVDLENEEELETYLKDVRWEVINDFD